MQHKLLTKAIAKKLPALGTREHVPTADKVAVVKFFDPTGRATWYGMEYDPAERRFFGYVVGPLGPDCDEWGYFSLAELERARCRFGLKVERDAWFNPTRFAGLPIPS